MAAILGRYQQGLEAYALAASSLTSSTATGGDFLLGLGDRISAEYQRLSREAGFRECDRALPL